MPSQTYTTARCNCEYPCDCIEVEGRRYSEPQALVGALFGQRDPGGGGVGGDQEVPVVARAVGDGGSVPPLPSLTCDLLSKLAKRNLACCSPQPDSLLQSTAGHRGTSLEGRGGPGGDN
jgi:hypothetical protein